MSTAPRPHLLKPLAGLLAVAALGAGGFLLLRTPPAPAPAPLPVPAPKEAPKDAPPAPAPAGGGTGSVAGRVLRGAEGETPVAGAAVEVFAIAGDSIPFLAPLAKGESGADGKFRIGGLEEDTGYRVRASCNGTAPAAGYGKTGGPELELRLLNPVFVAGVVKDDETKGPVAGARVSCGEAVGTTTGADGTFRLEGVPEGGVQIQATAEGYANVNRRLPVKGKGREGVVLLMGPTTSVAGVVLGPDGKPAAGAHVMVVSNIVNSYSSNGMTAGADGTFRAENVPVGASVEVSAQNEIGFAAPVSPGPLQRGKPAEGLVLRIVPAATLVVTVLDESGKPVEGAEVSHAPETKVEADQPEDGISDPEMAQVMAAAAPRPTDGGGTPTDAAGVARLRPIHAGRTVVTAHKEEFVRARATVEAVAAAETPVALRLAAGATLTGKVVDDLGNPVGEVSVTVTRYLGEDPVSERRESRADGAFRIGGLEGNGFDLSAQKAGFLQQSELHAVDPSAGPLTVTLQRAGAVAGVVQDGEGKPVASFQVASKRTDRKGRRDLTFGGGDDEGKSFDDPEGRFRLEGLVPGTYEITGRSGEFGPGRVADVVVEAGATAEVKVVLPPGITLRGIVVRKGEETPIAGASVEIAKGGPFGGMDVDFDMDYGPADGETPAGGDGQDVGDVEEIQTAKAEVAAAGGGSSGATTGADGRFVLKGLEAGTVDLKVKAKEFAPATRKGVAVPSEDEVRILLAEGAAVEGTVYDAQKAPKSGAMIMLQRLPVTMKMATTDARGHYRIGGLAPGKYLFYVMDNMEAMSGGGMNMKSESITLEEGKTLVKDHRMGEGVKVTGRVTRGGKPVGGTMVMLLPGAGRKNAAAAMMSGSGFAMATTKEDGTYEITGLSPGTYTAMIGMGNGGGPAPGDPVEIAPGATEVRRDIALSRNAVRGIVVDGDGEPVEGAQVHAVASGKNVTRVADLGEAVSSMGGQAQSGPDGRFAMEDMNPGSFTIQASLAGRGSAVVEDVVPSEAGTEVRVVLDRGVEVTVRVLDAEGKPISGAGIYLSDPHGMDLTGMEMFDGERTGADGRVVVTAPRGTIHFEAIVRGHAPGTAVAATDSGAEVVITLPRGAALEVLVTDAGGSPRSGASIRLLDAAGNPYAARVTPEGLGEMLASPATGSDGKYSRGDLPAGTYVVRAAAGERTADATVTVAAGETKSVNVRLP